MLKTDRNRLMAGFELLGARSDEQSLRERLEICSPCPPPSMVLAHAQWLRCWESQVVGYGHAQWRREQLPERVRTVLNTARGVAGAAPRLPRWPATHSAAERRAVMAADIVTATEEYDGTTGLLLLAPTGKGKTVGSVHLLFALWERSFRDYARVPAPMFAKAADLAAARRCHPLGEGEPQLLVDATEAQLLIIDDLGQDEKRDGSLMDVLDARYDAGLPSVVTSGFTVEQLSERYGQALVRRIIETNGAGKIVNGFKALLRAAGGGK